MFQCNVSLFGTDDYAKHTLIDCVAIRESGIKGAGQGIWSTKPIEKGTVFGPYDGRITKLESEARESGYAWMVCDVMTAQLWYFYIHIRLVHFVFMYIACKISKLRALW